ncbi:MAG: rRNA maturation RNase YbeY [bacterium]
MNPPRASAARPPTAPSRRKPSVTITPPPVQRRRRSRAQVVSRRRVAGVTAAAVKRDADAILALLAVDGELSIALVSDAEIHALNHAYRGKDRPTDVLAFALREGENPHVHADVLGDVVISLDTAARQAAARGHGIAHEVRFLLAHGILHLLGYDHERSPAEARRMFAKQRRLLSVLSRDT